MMNKQNRKMNRRLGAIALAIPLALSGSWILPALAQTGEGSAVRFVAPAEEGAGEYETAGGGVRGAVRFAAPAQGGAGEYETAGGGTRGEVTFAAPAQGGAGEYETAGGGVRNGVTFAAPNQGGAGEYETAGGGVRSDELRQVIPLIPSTKMGHTVAGHPTIFVYVPHIGAKQVFFSLQDENRNHHYQTSFEIAGKGGVVSFTLPKEAPALEKGKNYIWHFVMVEKGEIMRPDSYEVSGWIKRVDAPTEDKQKTSMTAIDRAVLYGKLGVWYETLEVLASARLAQPGNATLVKEWEDLLKQVGLEAVASQPIAEQF
ncbi:MAG: DUF928 domain-containing protein [Hormoscilla sp.]